MNNPMGSALLSFLLLGAGALHAKDMADQWALEADLGGTAVLASHSTKDQGKTGLSSGLMVRFGRNDTWDTGFGFNVFTLQNNVRLRPATFLADRRLGLSGHWAPFLRIGAGLGADQSSGALSRLVVRGGVGVRRSMDHQWDFGLKSELWYSPRSEETGHDMFFLTAGLTLSRSFARAVPPVKVDKEPDPVKPEVPESTQTAHVGPPLQGEDLPKPVQILTAPPTPLHILFRTNGWALAKSDIETKEKALAIMAQFLLANPTVPAEIHGHADSTGPLGYNMALSRRRAETLRTLFVKRWGLKPERFALFAHGSKKPVASNGTPLGRAKNRRAVVIVLSEWLP